MRSGFSCAACSATLRNGHEFSSLQSCTTGPFSRQPVSPNTTIWRGLATGTGRSRPPALTCLAPAGIVATQTRTGNAALGAARSVIGSDPPSAIRAGQAGSFVTRRASTAPCPPYWLQPASVVAPALGERRMSRAVTELVASAKRGKIVILFVGETAARKGHSSEYT